MSRIYVACLASYNNGVMHGAWIDVTDVDTMQEQIADMLRASRYPNVMVEHEGKQVPSAEEYAVHDYDDLPSKFGEYPKLEELVAYVERLAEWEERGVPAWVVEKLEDHVTPDDFLGMYASLGDYAYEMTGEEGIPSHVLPYVNWDSMGEDWRLSGDIYTIEHGYKEVYVFNNR